MSSITYSRSLICAAKRLRISPPSNRPIQRQSTRHLQQQTLPESVENELAQLRLPRAVQATYLAPLKRTATHRIPTCDLQLRSYSVRNLEVFTDFALRAAYFLHLPASGPVPLPRITERWTVPRSNFIFKKSQQNFERKTLRRLIQIQDGHPEVVSIWLAFLRKFQYFGVGMKANVWEYSGLDVGKELDEQAEKLLTDEFKEEMELFGTRDARQLSVRALEKKLLTEPFKGQWGAYAAMSGNSTVPAANRRIHKQVVGSQQTFTREPRETEATEKNKGGEDDASS